MNWIKGQPTENGNFHIIHKLFDQKNGKIIQKLHITTIESLFIENIRMYGIPNTDILIDKKSILAFMPVQKIPVEFYDAE